MRTPPAILIGAAAALLLHPVHAQLPADSMPYKCAIIDAAGEPGLIIFDSIRPAPERFVDLHLAAAAGMTKIDQARVQRLIECARADLDFRNPDAQELLRALPPIAL